VLGSTPIALLESAPAVVPMTLVPPAAHVIPPPPSLNSTATVGDGQIRNPLFIFPAQSSLPPEVAPNIPSAPGLANGSNWSSNFLGDQWMASNGQLATFDTDLFNFSGLMNSDFGEVGQINEGSSFWDPFPALGNTGMNTMARFDEMPIGNQPLIEGNTANYPTGVVAPQNLPMCSELVAPSTLLLSASNLEAKNNAPNNLPADSGISPPMAPGATQQGPTVPLHNPQITHISPPMAPGAAQQGPAVPLHNPQITPNPSPAPAVLGACVKNTAVDDSMTASISLKSGITEENGDRLGRSRRPAASKDVPKQLVWLDLAHDYLTQEIDNEKWEECVRIWFEFEKKESSELDTSSVSGSSKLH
jgi:hypothetical protein